MRAIRGQLDKIYPNILRQSDTAFAEFHLEELEATGKLYYKRGGNAR